MLEWSADSPEVYFNKLVENPFSVLDGADFVLENLISGWMDRRSYDSNFKKGNKTKKLVYDKLVYDKPNWTQK